MENLMDANFYKNGDIKRGRQGIVTFGTRLARRIVKDKKSIAKIQH